MEKSEIIVLQSAYNKTPGQYYFIQPCRNPQTGEYPDCVRETVDEKSQVMILSESDKEDMRKGRVFIPANRTIKVQHGTTFDLSIPKQKAEWEAIQYSSMIAKDRSERRPDGSFVIDGEKPYVDENRVVKGHYGKADLYIFRPGVAAQNRNAMKEKIYKATGLILSDPAGLAGWITKCRLLEKDMSRSNENDIKDYLLTQAEKYPDKIIELYTGTTTQIRLLLLEAINKHIVNRKNGLIIYSDDIVLGSSMDSAVAYLSQPEHLQVKKLIEQETFPDLFVKKAKSEAKSEAKKEE